MLRGTGWRSDRRGTENDRIYSEEITGNNGPSPLTVSRALAIIIILRYYEE